MKKDIKIIYEDNHILVAIKPENILSQEDSTSDLDMLTLLKAYLKEKYNKPGNVFLGLVHRLDQRVSGLMVFAKTSKAASRLAQDIKERNFEKVYYAIITGDIDNEGTLKNYLKKVKKNNEIRAMITQKPSNDAKEAILNYKKIKSVVIDGKIFTLVEVHLITGRYNQIRAQFAHINKPLINDFKYGYRFKNYNDQLGLACIKLSFNHPVTKEKLSFTHIPDTGIWSKFI